MLAQYITLLVGHNSGLLQGQQVGLNVEMNRYMKLARKAIKSGDQDLAVQNIKLAESYGLHRYDAARLYAESQVVEGKFNEATANLKLFFEGDKPGSRSASTCPTTHAWHWFLAERKEGITERTNKLLDLTFWAMRLDDADGKEIDFSKLQTSRVCQVLINLGCFDMFKSSRERTRFYFDQSKKLDPKSKVPEYYLGLLAEMPYDKKSEEDYEAVNNPDFVRFDPMRVLSQTKK